MNASNVPVIVPSIMLNVLSMHRDTGRILWIGEANQPGMMFFGYSFYKRGDGTKLILMACQNGL